VRTKAPEVASHTVYTEVSTSKAGSALDWGTCSELHFGKSTMVFLTLQINPHSQGMYFDAGEDSRHIHQRAHYRVQVGDSMPGVCASFLVSLHVCSPVTKELDGDPMAPINGPQDSAPEFLSRQ
jgi:hypothetical protein